MSRNNPNTVEEANIYQFEDDIKILKQVALTGSKNEFKEVLNILEQHIKNYKKYE